MLFGVWAGTAINRLSVRLLAAMCVLHVVNKINKIYLLAYLLMGSYPGEVVHIHVPLATKQCNLKYRSKGSDTLRQVWRRTGSRHRQYKKVFTAYIMLYIAVLGWCGRNLRAKLGTMIGPLSANHAYLNTLYIIPPTFKWEKCVEHFWQKGSEVHSFSSLSICIWQIQKQTQLIISLNNCT